MTEKTLNNVTFLKFELFKSSNWLKAYFSTRVGGVSDGVFSSMNFRQKGDSIENVLENYRLFCRAASLSYDGITFSCQEHGVNIRTVTSDDRGKGLHTERGYTNVDGLISCKPGIVLTTFHADCAAVFLADPVNKAIGLVHAGWRGTAGKIASLAIREMGREYGSRPENILAGIGPSICYTCFEVDKPVYDEFAEFDRFTSAKPNTADKYIIDLKAINRQTLIEAGVKAKHIEVSPLCTKCNAQLFYSHRRDGDNRGSMAAFMEINYEK